MPKPYYKNVAGDFYVEDQCCITCGVPQSVAPDIFELDDQHCYVKRQPQTPDELYRTLRGMSVQEVDCIRYGGHDREIVRRLAELGEAGLCDDADLAGQFSSTSRVNGCFTSSLATPGDLLTTIMAVAAQQRGADGEAAYKIKGFRQSLGMASMQISFSYRTIFEVITVTGDGQGGFVLRTAPYMAVEAHDWLSTMAEVAEIVWKTDDELRSGGGQPTPY